MFDCLTLTFGCWRKQRGGGGGPQKTLSTVDDKDAPMVQHPSSPSSSSSSSSSSSTTIAVATSSQHPPGSSSTRHLSLTNSNAVVFHRTGSERQHDEYLEKLEVPTLEQISSIAQVQEAKEKEIEQKYGTGDEELDHRAREEAASKIQRTYRGHRARRELQGLTLDPTTRWVEALKAARFQNITDPKRLQRAAEAAAAASDDRAANDGDHTADVRRSLEARSHWHQVSNIASHAMGELPHEPTPPPRSSTLARKLRRSESRGRDEQLDLDDDSSSSSSFSSSTGEAEGWKDKAFKAAVPKRRRRRRRHNKKKAWAGKMMDLPYFLEMVDAKHRYGSNLRAYHSEWKKADTHQNFFYWLDYGDGQDVEIENVSRERLEKEQVRYLSREERMSYLVNIDSEGRLVWAKNGERITTSTDYRDSIGGIVPTSSKAKMFREDEIKAIEERHKSDSSHTSSSSDDDDDDCDDDDNVSDLSSAFSSAPASPTSTPDVSDAERRYPDPPGLKKPKNKVASKVKKHVSAHAILNRLMRKTLSKNTWIFVADTSMNLYVGIKQSGSFQHSSFMHGSRISAAGTIRIKRGQLRALNPLSGHYRPPARAFRHFVRHLHRSAHADLSRVSVSKSYAVLVGLEAYISARRTAHDAEHRLAHAATLVAHPSQARQARHQAQDHSRSADLERARIRQEKGTLGRVLEDARERVEERWTAIREPENSLPPSSSAAAAASPRLDENDAGSNNNNNNNTTYDNNDNDNNNNDDDHGKNDNNSNDHDNNDEKREVSALEKRRGRDEDGDDANDKSMIR